MLALGSVCGMTAVYTFILKSVTKRKRIIIIVMELSAMILLYSDRLAYIYRGDTSELGFVMTRVSNFLVYLMTLVVVMAVNRYIEQLVMNDCGAETVPRMLRFNDMCLPVGMILVVISQFTGFYYTFDETNHYVRAPGFIVCYIFPVLAGILELIVTLMYVKKLDKKISIPLMMFTVSPIVAGGIQVFTYGFSLVNIVMVGTVIIIYTFALMDMDETAVRAHEIEMQVLESDRLKMHRLFNQTANAFITAVEKKDFFSHGNSAKVADISRKIAERAGKSDEFCDQVYYAALLHDVGMIGIPDRIMEKTTELTEEEYDLIKRKPIMSSEILSSITEYPFLRDSALYSCERYDGNGYPEGLKGKEIPEIARIISVADAFVSMTSKKRFRDPKPIQLVKQEFIVEAGIQFDPEYSDIMAQMIDYELHEETGLLSNIGTSLKCAAYRSAISEGIPVNRNVTEIRFEFEPSYSAEGGFSAPSIILFDSYDRMVHDNPRSIEATNYIEYGEIWFDGHMVSTAARNMEMTVVPEVNEEDPILTGKTECLISAVRYANHVRVRLEADERFTEVVVALPESSKSACIGITGENCVISGIEIEQKDEVISGDEIRKIAEDISYIDRMESDVPNVQVDRNRSAATEAVEIKGDTQIQFHTMSLPSANLVWHCPYIVVYYSSDKMVGGKGFREYALIKLNGEYEAESDFAENRFSMKKQESFPGWDVWKEIHKKGLECKIDIKRNGDRLTIETENLGIQISDRIRILDGAPEVYVALTGNQIALTDIRVKGK